LNKPLKLFFNKLVAKKIDWSFCSKKKNINRRFFIEVAWLGPGTRWELFVWTSRGTDTLFCCDRDLFLHFKGDHFKNIMEIYLQLRLSLKLIIVLFCPDSKIHGSATDTTDGQSTEIHLAHIWWTQKLIIHSYVMNPDARSWWTQQHSQVSWRTQQHSDLHRRNPETFWSSECWTKISSKIWWVLGNVAQDYWSLSNGYKRSRNSIKRSGRLNITYTL